MGEKRRIDMDSSKRLPDKADSRKRLSHDKVASYILGTAADADIHELKQLADRADHIEHLLEIIKKQRAHSDLRVVRKKPKTPGVTGLAAEELVTEILAGSNDPETANTFLTHLVHSRDFYDRFLDLIKDINEDLSPGVVPEEVPMLSKEAFLAKVYECGGKPIPPTKKSPMPFKQSFQHLGQQSIYQRLKQLSLTYKISGGLAVTFVLVILFNVSMQFYQHDYKLYKASRILEASYLIYEAGAPRISGDFDPVEIQGLLDDNEEPPYLKTAKDLVTEVLDKFPESVRAQQIRAHIFLIKREYSTADSVLDAIPPEEVSRSAKLLNDRGVVKYEREKYKEAKQFFEAAITTNKSLREAYYNLALAEMKLGNQETADRLMDEYLTLENNEAWKEAVERMQQQNE